MKRFLPLALALAFAAIPLRAQAHFIWATVQPDGARVQLELADEPGKPDVPILGQKIGSINLFGIGKLVLESDKLHVSAPILGGRKAVGAELFFGVFNNWLVHFWAKGASDLDSATKRMGLAAEISLRKTNKGWEAQVVQDGKPVSGADVEIYAPGKATIVKKSSHEGLVPLPELRPGMLYIGADITHLKPGNYQGTAYGERRDLTSLTVRIG